MPPRKTKNKIVLESDSDSEIDLPIVKNNDKNNKTNSTIEDSTINFENYQFNSQTIYKYCDSIDSSLKNFDLNKTKELIKKIDEIKESITDKKNMNQRIIQELHLENNTLSNIQDSIENLISNINKHEEKLEKEEKLKAKENILNNQVVKEIPNNKVFTTIKQLSDALTNEHQQAILWRINTDAEGAKVYLQNFEPNTDKKKKTLQGTINILGNYNRSKGIRESYEVKVFKDDPKGSFWCTCADHKFNAGKKNIVCKHICFIVCKVLKITQTYFFEPVVKRLSDEHLQQLLAKFANNSDMWKDKQYVRKSDFITIDDFKIFPNPISDTCTFCYDEMTNGDKDIACACPICKHCFHEECMQVWLESHDKCSFCSNNFWTYYKRIKAGETKISLAANKL